jgi:hypothetical protein
MLHNSVKIVENGIAYYLSRGLFIDRFNENYEEFLALPFRRRVELSNIVLNTESQTIIKLRYLLEDCFDRLLDLERQSLQKFPA